MKNALLTGGAGFIGSCLAKRLIELGWQVHIIDNLSTGYRTNLPPEAHFTFLDLSRDDFVTELPKVQFDAVFHLAAQSSGEISFDDPVYDLKTNCLSTLLLLEWCHKNNIKRFLYTSSMSIYGDLERQPVKEDDLPKPKSFYGVGKLTSESYINIYSKMGINTTSLRPFNVYGPGQNMENLRQGMVSIYMAYILKNVEIPVKGSPDRYRDFIYVDDVIDAYLACLDNPKTFGKSFNLASGAKTHVHELIRAELVAFGLDPDKYPVKYSGSTPGDTFGIYADISALKAATNWRPKVSLKEGLEKMAQWALAAKK